MEIKQKNSNDKGEFYIEEGGLILGRMSYVWAGTDKIIIDHTEVNEVLKGKSAGKQMLLKAIEFAKEKSIKIIPLCPFAKSMFDKVPEFRFVL